MEQTIKACVFLQELPPQIEETAHKALFYMTKLSASNKYMFESSAYPSKFLGFEPVDHNPSVNKLVLRDRVHDEVDEFSEVSLSWFQKAQKHPARFMKDTLLVHVVFSFYVQFHNSGLTRYRSLIQQDVFSITDTVLSIVVGG